MEKNIELGESGLVCDNPNCDYVNKEVKFEDYPGWVNKPCPKCGENLLTEEDLDNARIVHFAIDYINSLSEEELEKMNNDLGLLPEDIFKLPIFEGKPDLSIDYSKGKVSMEVSTNKDIKIKNIKKID